MISPEQVVDRCNELIARVDLGLADRDYNFDEPVAEVTARLSVLIGQVTGERSAYSRNLAEIYKQKTPVYALQALRGLLIGFKRDFENGELVNVRQQVEAVVVSEILEQAKKLLNSTSSIHPAAAVIVACAAAEEFLRNWCENQNIQIPLKKRSLSTFAEELQKADLLPVPESRRILGWADHRNDAAHGRNWNQVTHKIAERLIKEVEDFLIERMRSPF